MVPSNAIIDNMSTNVPNADVIIPASGLRDRPKSATFAAHILLRFVMKTFRDFKSRWITGGFMKCRNYIPLAISRAIDIRSLQFNGISLTFLCNKSNKLPYV